MADGERESGPHGIRNIFVYGQTSMFVVLCVQVFGAIGSIV